MSSCSFPLRELERRVSDKEIVLFLGGVDVGKTTLIKELYAKVNGEIVDADVGQSAIGPPACISRGIYQQSSESSKPEVRESYFVGDISPRGNFIQVLTGLKRMVSLSERPCLIDTDGYIDGGAARAFKGEMINLVKPDLLALLQRRGELDYYQFFARKGLDVIDVPIDHHGTKSREERIRAREAAFREYFETAELREWSLKELRFERSLLGHGELLDPQLLGKMLGCQVAAAWRLGDQATVVVDGYAQSLGTVKRALNLEYINLINRSSLGNLLLGCLDGSEFQGLGILKEMQDDKLRVLTPVKRATILQPGSLKVTEGGSHLRVG